MDLTVLFLSQYTSVSTQFLQLSFALSSSDEIRIHYIQTMQTRWLYCVECPQYSIRLEALRYVCASLLPAFDAA